MITCGIDWAEGHHHVAVLDDAGRVLARRRIDTGITGFSELMSLLAEHAEDPVTVPVAIETDKNLIVVALQTAGLAVFAINPRAAVEPSALRRNGTTPKRTTLLTSHRSILLIGLATAAAERGFRVKYTLAHPAGERTRRSL